MKRNTTVIAALVVAVSLWQYPGPARADKPLTITVARLTLGTALKIAQGAIVACRRRGFEVTATVVDRDGITQVVLRDTLAPPLSLLVSADKAYTSAMFNARGTVLQGQPRHQPLTHAGAHLLFVGGSVPIEVGGVLYGAIGVSGTPNGRTDEECAAAGLKAVRQALELQ